MQASYFQIHLVPSAIAWSGSAKQFCCLRVGLVTVARALAHIGSEIETLRGGGREYSAKMTTTLQDRKRRISAELEPPRGEEEEEDVIGPMPAEPAKGTKKRKGERADDGGKFKCSCSN